MKATHVKILIYEEERTRFKWLWKYLDNIYLQCIICDAIVLSTYESVKNHLKCILKKNGKIMRFAINFGNIVHEKLILW